MTLKELLRVNHFSEVVGVTQPEETCPMIDHHQSVLKNKIQECYSQIKELEETDEDDNQIDRLAQDILGYEFEIKELEKSRKVIMDCRSVGQGNRDTLLKEIDNNLREVNGRYYILTRELKKFKSGEFSSNHFEPLEVHYADVVKNYDLLIEWADCWNSWELFDERFDSIIPRLDLTPAEFDEFEPLIAKVENFFKNNEELSLADIKLITRLFPDAINTTIEDCTEIKVIDLIHLWEMYFPYLNYPEIKRLKIE